MPAQQSALSFTQELLALLEWNSFEIEVSLRHDDLPEPKRILSEDARHALQVELDTVKECCRQKQYPWAIDAQTNALKIFEEHLGVLNIQTLECLRDIGNLYFLDRKLLEAQNFFVRAWRIARSVLPRKHDFLQSVEKMHQNCMTELKKAQNVVNLSQCMGKVIFTPDESAKSLGHITSIQTQSDFVAALKKAQKHLALAKYREAERLLKMSARYLAGANKPSDLTKLKFIYGLWATALSGLGQSDSAHKTRLLAQAIKA
jgi:tetratricopeptide (TPR) repeat protein